MEQVISELVLQNMAWWAAIIVLVILAVGAYSIPRIVDHRLDKRQEVFRTEQSLILAKFEIETQAKFDNNAKLYDMQLGILPELWSKLTTAQDEVVSTLGSVQFFIDLWESEKLSGTRLEAYFNESKNKLGDCQDKWDQDKQYIKQRELLLSQEIVNSIDACIMLIDLELISYAGFFFDIVPSTPPLIECDLGEFRKGTEEYLKRIRNSMREAILDSNKKEKDD